MSGQFHAAVALPVGQDATVLVEWGGGYGGVCLGRRAGCHVLPVPHVGTVYRSTGKASSLNSMRRGGSPGLCECSDEDNPQSSETRIPVVQFA